MFGLMHATRDAFERDSRLLREALIIIGRPAVPYIVELVHREPMRYYNNIEVLGNLDNNEALRALVSLGRQLNDSVGLRHCWRRSSALCVVMARS
jgi:hypothetical protein